MEKIYDPEGFRSSDHMQTKEYFKKYSEECIFLHQKSTDKEYLHFSVKAELDVDNAVLKELKKACSIDLLAVPNEPTPLEVPEKLSTKTKLDVVYPLNEAAKQLHVVRCQEPYRDEIEQWVAHFRTFLRTVIVTNPASSAINDILPGTNFIYSIIIYKPFSIRYGFRNSTEKMRNAFEIEAIGTNTIAEVADKIQCILDLGLYKEVENTTVDLEQLTNAKEHYPSKTIFIDGVFYNDFRSSNAIDYSEIICKWAQDKAIGEFTTAKMDEVLLESLTPRFGYPYVFLHQGNCEHIFVFADARLMSPNDCLISKKYPRILTITRSPSTLCFICAIAKAMWIVLNCDRFPQEKVFLCTECCDCYLYVNGQKACKFKLYPFYGQVK